jgi:hypothetical protein
MGDELRYSDGNGASYSQACRPPHQFFRVALHDPPEVPSELRSRSTCQVDQSAISEQLPSIFDEGNVSENSSSSRLKCRLGTDYYQAPFNCWEHVFIFAKGHLPSEMSSFPSVLRLRPVFKMVNGENVLGHSAPFPKEIPELLLDRLEREGTVLDPFSGSMTTGRAAYAKGFQSINIDCHREYCDLGLQLLERETQQLNMFKALALAERYSAELQLPTEPQSRKISYTKQHSKKPAKAGAKARNGHG